MPITPASSPCLHRPSVPPRRCTRHGGGTEKRNCNASTTVALTNLVVCAAVLIHRRLLSHTSRQRKLARTGGGNAFRAGSDYQLKRKCNCSTSLLLPLHHPWRGRRPEGRSVSV